MIKHTGIVKKFILLIVFLLFVTSMAIIFVNRWFYQRDMRAQIEEVQLPLMSKSIMPYVDSTILEPARALTLLAKNPFLLDWMKKGEPVSGEENVYQLLQLFAAEYNTLGANLVSEQSRKYHDYLEGERKPKVVAEGDLSWFHGFRDMHTPIGIKVYIGDDYWGTKAFINVRIEVDGQWRGILSAAINLEDFAKNLNKMKVGKNGSVFMVDEQGIIRFIEDSNYFGKPVGEVFSAYHEQWARIKSNEHTTFSYINNGVERIAIVTKIPVLEWYIISEASMDEFEASIRRSTITTIGLSVVFIIFGCFFGMIFARTITRPLNEIANSLALEADNMSGLADKISRASGNLDQSAEVQSAVVDGANASIREMSGFIGRNADDTKAAVELMRKSDNDIQAGLTSINQMTQAMNDINRSSSEIGKILKTIEDIAFQTNLLALNAAVEAARAGEAGQGFAVVADEVRNLAQRSAASVHETAALISATNNRIGRGMTIVSELDAKFSIITESLHKIEAMVEKIGHATTEQTQGIGYVNEAMREVDQNSGKTADEAGAMTQISNDIIGGVDNLRVNVELLGLLLNRRH